MERSISEKLLLLPIFQGFSRLDFLDVIEKTPLDFCTFRDGQYIVRAGDACTHLYALLEGTAESILTNAAGTYTLFEQLRAPWVVQPYCLFGLHTHFSRGLTALGEVQVVRIEKRWVHELQHRHFSFQLNLLNMVCAEAQNYSSLLNTDCAVELESQFSAFVRSRCLRPSGHKVLKTGMENLAHELRTSRLSVSRMLRQLADRRLLQLTRERITIPMLEMLPI